MSKKAKAGIIAGVIVIVVVVLCVTLHHKHPDKITYEYSRVVRGDISTSITATGTVEPVTQVEVGTQVSGIVDKIYVDYNSVVKKGQVIAELDKINLTNELASRKCNLDIAKTKYEYQLKEYTRTKTLYDKNMISESEYDAVFYTYKKSQK